VTQSSNTPMHDGSRDGYGDCKKSHRSSKPCRPLDAAVGGRAARTRECGQPASAPPLTSETLRSLPLLAHAVREAGLCNRLPPREEDSRHAYALATFGGGPRICLGINFAQLEVMALSAYIRRTYHPEPRQSLGVSS
jgi:Cytochrome P450